MERNAGEGAADLAIPLEVDRQRGKYKVLRRLAVGGMAELFLARATGIEGFEKLVVLKRILPQHATDARFVRMFLQEARLAATLHHSNLGQVYDVGQDSTGAYFFAMEYIHGVDLRRLGPRESDKPLPLEHALTIIAGAAAGLHYAHEKRGADGNPLGLVHRDVSPSNVLVGFDGVVKVVDFGIAKATDQRNETRPGTIKGKAAYMSPEQCLGKPLGRQSDIFAIGILLYELTTHSFLFNGDTELAIIRQIVDAEVPLPSSQCPDYPPALERIVMRALHKSPALRYESALALQLAIEDFAQEYRLQMSAARLARYLQERFGKDFDGWQQAERAGMSLIDFMASTSGLSNELYVRVPSDEERSAPSRSGSAAAGTAATLELPADAATGSVVTPPASAEASIPGARATPGDAVSSVTHPRWRRALRFVVPALAVALLVSYLGARRLAPSRAARVVAIDPSGASTAPTRATPVPRPPAVPPPTVRFELVGLPSGAQLYFDGKLVQGSVVETNRSNALHRVRIVARGYQSKELELQALSDRLLSVDLRPLRRSSTKQGARLAPSKPASPRLELTSPREL